MWTRVWNKLRSLRRDDTFEHDLADELDFHRAMLEHDRARAGVEPGAAAREARRRVGNVTIAREDARRAWAFVWLEELLQDLRIALRGYRRSPVVTGAVVVVIALGLGANGAAFRLIDAAVLETLPVLKPRELVLVGGRVYSYPAFQELAAGTRDVFASVAARWSDRVNLTVPGHSAYVDVEIVSGTYFETLGVTPFLGRLLGPADDGAEGAHPVCVISHGLWQRLFGADPAIVGTVIRLRSEPFQVVGVTGPAFEGSALHDRYDLQVPLSMAVALGGNPRDSHGARYLGVIARLNPGVTREQAESTARARYDGLEKPGDRSLTVSDGRQGFGSVRRRLLDTAVAAQMLSLCVLVIACASLMGLLLARMAASRGELATRLALGASRPRLVRQLVAETAGLVAAGGTAAVAVAVALDGALIGMLRGPAFDLRVDALPTTKGLVVALALAAAVAVVVALIPATTATHALPVHRMRGDRGGTRSGWFDAVAIAAQIAACLVLLFGAGLLARTLHGLRSIDLGIDPSNVVVMTAGPRQSGYTQATEGRFYEPWLERARRVPGVTSVSLAGITAMSNGMFAMAIEVPGAVPRAMSPNDNFNIVTPDYFETVGLPILAGRPFSTEDTAASPGVAIVNEQFVQHYWPGQSPIGRHFLRGSRQVEIVGLVRTAKYQSLKEDPQITIYVPHAQQPWGEMTLHARVTTAQASAALVQAARDIDPTVPVDGVSTLADYVDANLSNERVLNLLGMLFGGLSLLVAAAGLYGMVAYAVARRTREIGIRSAIGAQRLDIVGLFAGRVLWLVAAGIVVGIPFAVMAAQALGGVLYGVEPTSTSTLAAAALLLGGVAAAAAVVPALRGARANPSVALREP